MELEGTKQSHCDKPPNHHGQGNVQVYNVRIPVEGAPRTTKPISPDSSSSRKAPFRPTTGGARGPGLHGALGMGVAPLVEKETSPEKDV